MVSGSKQHQVGVAAFADLPSSRQSEALRRQAGHFVDCLRQREDTLLPAVVTQHARKRSPEARVRTRVVGQAIRADHACRMLQDAATSSSDMLW